MARGLDQKSRRLIAARGIRGTAQGLLVVDFTLYLRALDWPAASIGALFAAGMAVSIVLTMLLGPLSDRIGRKRFLKIQCLDSSRSRSANPARTLQHPSSGHIVCGNCVN